MPDNTRVNAGGGDYIRDLDKGGVKTQVVAIDIGGDGAETLLNGGNPLPVADGGLGADGAAPPGITGTGVRGWLRAIYEKLTGSVAVTGPLTNTQLRAATVVVDVDNFPAGFLVTGEVEVKNDAGNPLPVDTTDRAGRLLGHVTVDTVPEIEVKNDAGNPLAVDTTDRSGRLLGKVTTDDGGQVTQGALADAAVDGDSAGSLSAKLRGLLKVVGTGTDAATASGVAGTLQSYNRRIRDKIDALVGQIPAALVGGRLDVNVGNTPSVTQSPTGYNTPPGGPTFTLGAAGTFFTVDTGTMGRWITIQTIANASNNTLTWEGSNDGVTWQGFGLSNVSAAAGTGLSSAPGGVSSFHGIVPFQQVRVRLSNYVGGTTTVAVYFHATVSPYTTMPVDTELPAAVVLSDTEANPTAPAVGAFPHYFGGATWSRAYHAQAALDANSGSGFAPVGLFGYNGATWDRLRSSIANGLAVDVTRQSAALEVIGTATSVAVLTNFPVDANRYRWVSVQISGTFVGTYIFEVSNDNLNWTPTAIVGSSQATPGVNATGSTVPGQFHGPINGRYFRVRCSAYTSGTITATVEFFAMPGAFNMMAVDTELPNAGALADSTSNPTAPAVGAFPHLWDTVASAWQRQRAVRSMSDGDAGGFTASVGLTAFNGASYDRLRTGPTLGSLLAALAPSNYQTPPGGPSFSLSAAGTFFTVDTSTLGRWMSLQVIANTGGNTIIWEASNDGGVTWSSFVLGNAVSSSIGQTSNTTGGAGTLLAGQVPGQQVRVRVSNFVSGTITVAVYFHATPPVPTAIGVDTELPAAAALADATSNPTVPGVGSFGLLWNASNTTWARMRDASSGDGLGQGVLAAGMYAATSPSNYDRLRTPNTFKTITATAAGDTALWTPTTGKKFRILRYRIEVTGDATQAGAGDIDVILRDATTVTPFAVSIYIPAVALNAFGGYTSGWVDLGNGFLSAAANNVLNVNLSAALTAGKVRVVVAGTEE